MKIIRPGDNDAPLKTRRPDVQSTGAPAAMVRFAAIALALALAGFPIFVLRS